MNRYFNYGLSLFSIFLLSCDGPNTQSEIVAANRGSHNDDGFQIDLKINNGASITQELVVAVQLSAIDAAEMYVTQESACNIGGVWEPYKTFKQSTLQNANQVNFFYVKVRNKSRESNCAFTSIEHDSVAPTVQLVSPSNYSVLSNPNELPLIGTCSEDSLVTIAISSIVVGTVSCLSGHWSKTVDVSLLPTGAIAVQIKASDQAQNYSSVQSFTYSK